WNFDSSNNFSIQASTATSITLSRIILTYTNGTTPLQVAFTYTSATSVLYSGFQSFSSCKTNRDYEVGFVYQDRWTRKSTVLTSVKNTLYIPQSFSVNQNRILVDINHPPP